MFNVMTAGSHFAKRMTGPDQPATVKGVIHVDAIDAAELANGASEYHRELLSNLSGIGVEAFKSQPALADEAGFDMKGEHAQIRQNTRVHIAVYMKWKVNGRKNFPSRHYYQTLKTIGDDSFR